jgi:hypothetical protein
VKRALAAVLLAGWALSSPARAVEAAGARLADGVRRYEDQDYRRAIVVLEAVLGDPGASRAQKATAYEYTGLSWLILGQQQLARDALTALFKLDPRHPLSDPSQSPKLREFYEEVRKTVVPAPTPTPPVPTPPPRSEPPSLTALAPSEARAGTRLTLRARLEPGGAVRKVTLTWRERGGAFRRVAAVVEGEACRAEIDAPRSATALELYWEALGAGNATLAQAGSAEAPEALPLTGGGPSVPGYKRWYVWTIVGVVVVGAAVGVGVELGRPHVSGSLGTVGLALHF